MTLMIPTDFTEDLVATERLTHHVVSGGEGFPLLLVNGWPQTWYAWRLVLSPLTRHFRVIAAEPRGNGGSEKPAEGYDTGTLADDLAELMTTMGHDRFAVIGHDVGMWIGYALAADHSDRVTALVVTEAVIPGLSEDPTLFGSHEANGRLFHFAFNQLDGLNELLVRGREEVYFGHQFASKAGRSLEGEAIDAYIDALRQPEALRASFGPYRDLEQSIAQNRERRRVPLTVPVLAVGGGLSVGDAVAATMRSAAADVTGVVLDEVGHFPSEEAPEELLAAVVPFLLQHTPHS